MGVDKVDISPQRYLLNPSESQSIEYFNPWLAQPITVKGDSALATLDALNNHPIASDEAEQDYIMPRGRYREAPGRFRIFGENQDTFYCFLRAGDECKSDPPVYFETCLDLVKDHGFKASKIIDGDHVMVCPRFTQFLWHILGHYVCVRMTFSRTLSDGVNGIVFNEDVALDEAFVNPLRSEFPAGNTCFFSNGVICVPEWGAAFLDLESRDEFVKRYAPGVSHEWHSNYDT